MAKLKGMKGAMKMTAPKSKGDVSSKDAFKKTKSGPTTGSEVVGSSDKGVGAVTAAHDKAFGNIVKTGHPMDNTGDKHLAEVNKATFPKGV